MKKFYFKTKEMFKFMGRRKIITDEELLTYIERFLNERCEGKVELLKIPAIGEFIRSNGMPEVNDVIIRRNKKARNFIENLKKKQENEDIYVISTYKTLDVDAFIQRNCSISAIKKSLTELNIYYKKISESANKICEKYKDIEKKYKTLKVENKKISEKNVEYSNQNNLFKNEIKMLKNQNKALKMIINTYVYPEIANELLKQSGILKNTGDIIDPKAIEENIIKTDTKIKSNSNVITQMFRRFEE